MKTNVLKTAFNKAALTALAVTGFAVAPAGAQNPNFAPGDLLLYFIQFGGSQTVPVNLGAAYGYRDATANSLNFINIGGTLTGTAPAGAAYPADWYDDPNDVLGSRRSTQQFNQHHRTGEWRLLAGPFTWRLPARGSARMAQRNRRFGSWTAVAA